MVHDAQPDGPATAKTVSENPISVDTAEGSGAVAATEISAAAAAHMVDETAPEPMEERLPSSPTAAMPDDPASASIDEDRGDWRTDTGTDARAAIGRASCRERVCQYV